MNKLLSFVAAGVLMAGGFALVGCASNHQAATDTHSALFGGGNGEFGESPRIAGEYENNRSNGGTPQSVANTSD
jgi:hypothetical protein